MPEEIDLANEIEIVETDNVVTEQDRGRLEEMTVTRNEEIKWQAKPLGGENILPVW